MDENGVGWSPYLRVRVWLNITRPLIWGNLISVDDSPTWIPLKYKRLSNFYFRCGIIKHSPIDCAKGLGSNKIHDYDLGKYGVWMRASPAKILWKAQAQKSYSMSSSFDKQKTFKEEAMLATNSRGENLENFESRKYLILEEDILAANCFETTLDLMTISQSRTLNFLCKAHCQMTIRMSNLWCQRFCWLKINLLQIRILLMNVQIILYNWKNEAYPLRLLFPRLAGDQENFSSK